MRIRDGEFPLPALGKTPLPLLSFAMAVVALQIPPLAKRLFQCFAGMTAVRPRGLVTSCLAQRLLVTSLELVETRLTMQRILSRAERCLSVCTCKATPSPPSG